MSWKRLYCFDSRPTGQVSISNGRSGLDSWSYSFNRTERSFVIRQSVRYFMSLRNCQTVRKTLAVRSAPCPSDPTLQETNVRAFSLEENFCPGQETRGRRPSPRLTELLRKKHILSTLVPLRLNHSRSGPCCVSRHSWQETTHVIESVHSRQEFFLNFAPRDVNVSLLSTAAYLLPSGKPGQDNFDLLTIGC